MRKGGTSFYGNYSRCPIPSSKYFAPNTTTKQSLFFQTLSALICDEGYNESDYKILLGGDLNVAMDPNLDCLGVKPFGKRFS